MTLFLYLVLTASINFLPTKSEEEFIRIKSDGTLQNDSATPACKRGQKMSLNQYHYITTECYYGPFCSHQKNSFSMDAKLILHSMCSFKEACVNLSFPVKSDLHKYKPDGVLIGYDCFDQTEEFSDICSQTKLIINNTVNLMVNNTARHYRQCRCLLGCKNEGDISITLKDLRLNSFETLDDKRCSDAVLEINKTKLMCNKNRTDLGSVFNVKLLPPVTSTDITFTQKEENMNFEMVWLVLKVKGSANMVCEGDQKQGESASETSSVSANEVPSNQSAGKNREAESGLPGSVYTIIVGLTVIVMLAVPITVIHLIRKRRRKIANTMPQKGCSKQELLEQLGDETYDVCNKFIRTAPPTCRNNNYDHLPITPIEMSS